MRKYIGIDIGKKGAIYMMNEDGNEEWRVAMPMI